MEKIPIMGQIRRRGDQIDVPEESTQREGEERRSRAHI